MPPGGSPTLQTGGQIQKWPTSGPGGYITAVAWGVPESAETVHRTIPGHAPRPILPLGAPQGQRGCGVAGPHVLQRPRLCARPDMPTPPQHHRRRGCPSTGARSGTHKRATPSHRHPWSHSVPARGPRGVAPPSSWPPLHCAKCPASRLAGPDGGGPGDRWHREARRRTRAPAPSYTRAVLNGGGGQGFQMPTGTNVHGHALRFMVMGRSLLQRLVVGTWRLVAVGGGWQRLAVGGWHSEVGGGWWRLAVGGW